VLALDPVGAAHATRRRRGRGEAEQLGAAPELGARRQRVGFEVPFVSLWGIIRTLAKTLPERLKSRCPSGRPWLKTRPRCAGEPAARKGRSAPTLASSSSVRGQRTSAFDLSVRSAARSTVRHRRPCRASNADSVNPTGPAPATTTS
jgi:hypothetical protein